MGKNLDQILAEVGDGDSVHVTLVTNQDNGIAGYAVGSLIYHAGSGSAIFTLTGGSSFRPPRLSTTGGEPLTFYFSDRMLDIDPPAPVGSFGHSPRQPFSANATDKLGVSVSLGFGPHIMNFTFHSWGGAIANVSMESRGNLLVGLGPPLGNSPNAVYVMSFTGVSRPPR